MSVLDVTAVQLSEAASEATSEATALILSLVLVDELELELGGGEAGGKVEFDDSHLLLKGINIVKNNIKNASKPSCTFSILNALVA